MRNDKRKPQVNENTELNEVSKKEWQKQFETIYIDNRNGEIKNNIYRRDKRRGNRSCNIENMNEEAIKKLRNCETLDRIRVSNGLLNNYW